MESTDIARSRNAILLVSYTHVDSFMGVSGSGDGRVGRSIIQVSVVRALISPDLSDPLQPRIKPFMGL